MTKCIKDYRRHSDTYLKGSEYDISSDMRKEHEAYFGEKLWERKAKSAGIIAKAKSKVTGKKGKK